jgi:TolB-like protein/class 3 adenylate cyclase
VSGEAISRRLAAILAADVAGYSRLMEADEEGTLARLKSLRRDLIDPKIALWKGRIVKTTGDGMLVEFASVLDAVRCAVAVQRGMVARNANLPEDRRVVLRTGINIGDIIVEGGDIYGDGVNVAARLEALSEPGGICISADVYRQVRDKLPYEFADRGEQMVKNIARPVHVYSLDAAAVERLPEVQAVPQASASPAHRRRAWRKVWPTAAALVGVVVIALGIRLGLMPARAPQGPAAPPRFSIVVLPFTNLSGDPAQDYLADVITEGLTTALARIKDSFVIARSTAFTYKGKPADVKQIGKDLGVRYVLEGSEERAGSRVRVNAQLIDAETGAHLWADQFDAERSDLLQMQDEIVTRVARVMQIELPAADIASAGRARPENLDAEDFAERCEIGFLTSEGGHDKVAAAFSLCEHALRIDGRNVIALAHLAMKYIIPVMEVQSTNRQADIRRADELASRALAIDPNYYLAHWAKAYVLIAQNRGEEAIVEAERSLALNPSFMEGYNALCSANNLLGRPDRCLELIDKVMRLSPRDPYLFLFFRMRAMAFFMKGQYDQAIYWDRRVVAITPFNFSFLQLSSALALTGHQAEAHEMLERYLALGDVHSKTIAQLRAQMLLFADNPAYVEFTERLCAGLRKAGMPER